MNSPKNLKKFFKEFYKDEPLQNKDFIHLIFIKKAGNYKAIYLLRTIIISYILYIPLLKLLPNIISLTNLEIQEYPLITNVASLALIFVISYFIQFAFSSLFISKKKKSKEFLDFAASYSYSYKIEPQPKVFIILSKYENLGVVIPYGFMAEQVPFGKWDLWTQFINKNINNPEFPNELGKVIKDIDELIMLHYPDKKSENTLLIDE